MAETPTINLLSPVTSATGSGRIRRKLRTGIIAAVLCMAVAVAAYSGLKSPSQSLQTLRDIGGPLAVLAHVGQLVVSSEKPLEGTKDDRVNILLLGMGGWGHDGPLLTDTIMLLSVKPSTGQVALISIPRDMLVEIPGYGWRKINNVNAFAEQEKQGSGGEATAAVVSTAFDMPVPYVVRIDFRGFEKLIDELGGITVNVDRGFTDTQYPAPEDEYQTVSFAAGLQKMSGARALMYARSRHGSNGEGSDFARSRRQQKILLAVKDALLSAGTLANPVRISNILGLLAEHVQTNIEGWEMIRFADIGSTVDTNNIRHLVIDDRPGGLLTAAQVDGAFVLVPHNNDYSSLAFAAAHIFDETVVAADGSVAPTVAAVRVEIQNGTKREGLASQTANVVEAAGFTVVHVGNAAKQNYERTVIYDLSDGQHPEALNTLRSRLSADVSVSIPGWLSADTVPSQVSLAPPAPQAKGVDFLIILGNTSVGPSTSS